MKKLASQQHDYIKTSLRLPRDLHEKVHASAREHGRGFNDELIARIAGADEVQSFKLLRRENAELRKMVREVLDNLELLKK
jgi:hypothetical protein